MSALYKDTQLTGQRYLVRATHPHFFSHNNFSCATSEGRGADVGAQAKSPPPHTVVVDMSMMTQVLEHNREAETITVQAGITFEVR